MQQTTREKYVTSKAFRDNCFFLSFFCQNSKKKREKKNGIGKKVQEKEDDEKEATDISTPI